MEELEIEPTKKDYAVCIIGQLRATKTSIDKLYENLIDVLDADLYLLIQKTNTDIDNDIELYDKKVIKKVIYDPPKDIESKFVNYNKLLKHDNYICYASLQMYYNAYMMGDLFGDVLEKNYRYVILTRSDFYHLFPFPNILQLHCTDDTLWHYEINSYGGINGTLMCVPSKYIKFYLKLFKSFLNDSKNIRMLNSVPFNDDYPGLRLNSEVYLKMLIDINRSTKKWNTGKLRSNAFISASSLQEITTWGAIMYDDTNKLYYKYETQYRDALLGLKEYNEELKKWTYHYDMNNNTKTILLS